jgi:hypothetical protein
MLTENQLSWLLLLLLAYTENQLPDLPGTTLTLNVMKPVWCVYFPSDYNTTLG